MAAYHVLRIDSLIDSLSLCNSANGFTFRLDASSDIIAQPGDLLLGFVSEPTNEVRYLFEVVSANGNSLVLKKKLESSEGVSYDFSSLPELQPNVFEKTLFPIEEEVFLGILSQLCRVHLSGPSVNAPIVHKPGSTIQTIYYGCPGTGKSFKVKGLTEGHDGKKAVYFGKNKKRIEMPEDETERIKTPSNIFRTTFHPDYDYATFVGTYKPLMKRPKGSEDDESVKEELSYDFVPQVFTKAYVRAWKSWEDDTLEGKDKNVFLIIEEINRGNCAQIFGDLFQLLDRKDGFSEFPIIPDAELGKYLKDEKVPYDCLRLPPNLHIYATMNTSDQSLFPMDSAFKRRWAMEYVPIKYKDTAAEEYKLNLYGTTYEWTEFLRLVNARILDATNSEDKQMGEYFIKNKEINETEFINKVMFYLWNDVCKDLFNATRMSRNYFLRDSKDTFFTFAELYSGRHRKGLPDKDPKDLVIGFMDYLKSEAEDNLNDQADEQGLDPMIAEQ